MEKKIEDISKYEMYADKALATYGITYKMLMARCDADGSMKVTIDKKEKKVKWYDFYKCSKEEYEEWKEYVIGDIKRKNPHFTEDSIITLFNTIDMVYGLRQDYLFLELPPLPQQEECSQEYRNLPHNPVY